MVRGRRLPIVWTLSAVCLAFGAPAPATQTRPDAARLVARAAAYVADYGERLSSIVAEERYDQWMRIGGWVVRQPNAGMRPNVYERRRRLVSDYLLVKVPGLDGWTPFRDVLEVDGKPVRDREQRLLNLFVDSPAHAMAQAARIAEEGTRFNLGNISRTINMPTLALLVLTDRHRTRFQFEAAGERQIAGVRTRALHYAEVSGPTMIHTSGDNDLAATGTFWIEPDTGTVLQSVLKTDDGTLESEITVTYRLEPRLELWVPGKMEERYRSAQEQIEGEATYGNFRRFKVETSEKIRTSALPPAAGRARDTTRRSAASPPRSRPPACSRGSPPRA